MPSRHRHDSVSCYQTPQLHGSVSMRLAQKAMRASGFLVALIGYLSLESLAGPITVLSNQIGFERSTDAATVVIPNAAIAFPGGTPCGEPVGVAGMGGSFSVGFGANSVTVSNPTTGALCIFNQGAVIQRAPRVLPPLFRGPQVDSLFLCNPNRY